MDELEKFDDFNEFLRFHTKEAQSLNWYSYPPQVYEKYKKLKIKITSPLFKEDKEEAINSCKSVMQECRDALSRINSNSTIFKGNALRGRTMEFLNLFLEYKKLYDLDFEKENKETTLKDFFPTLQPQQIQNLQSEFSKCRGIEMACFIHQMKAEGNLQIIKYTERSFKNFLTMFADIPLNQHEAVRKCFNPAILKGDFDLKNDKELETYKTKDRINTALKVG